MFSDADSPKGHNRKAGRLEVSDLDGDRLIAEYGSGLLRGVVVSIETPWSDSDAVVLLEDAEVAALSALLLEYLATQGSPGSPGSQKGQKGQKDRPEVAGCQCQATPGEDGR